MDHYHYEMETLSLSAKSFNIMFKGKMRLCDHKAKTESGTFK